MTMLLLHKSSVIPLFIVACITASIAGVSTIILYNNSILGWYIFSISIISLNILATYIILTIAYGRLSTIYNKK